MRNAMTDNGAPAKSDGNVAKKSSEEEDQLSRGIKKPKVNEKAPMDIVSTTVYEQKKDGEKTDN